MYYLIVYDVDVSKVGKLHKYLKQYMHWVQNSVFEGELSDADFLSVKNYILKLINKDTDSVLIFRCMSKYSIEKVVLGKERNETSTII